MIELSKESSRPNLEHSDNIFSIQYLQSLEMTFRISIGTDKNHSKISERYKKSWGICSRVNSEGFANPRSFIIVGKQAISDWKSICEIARIIFLISAWRSKVFAFILDIFLSPHCLINHAVAPCCCDRFILGFFHWFFV